MPVSKSKRSRYTPPPPKAEPPSRLWVPAAMFAMWGVGLAVVILNYTGLLFGDPANSYLILGLVLITAGFLLATRFR
jgi:hypothetical protein